jgi:hypothetical protein
MSTHRDRRITRAEAEQLLRTGQGGPEALSALLAAAASPAAAGEFAGEGAALAEFRAASLSTVPSPRRRHLTVKTALANLLTAKLAAAAAVAATATGGVALAAATGHLSGSTHPAAHPVAVTSVAGATDDPGETPGTESGGAPATEAAESRDTGGSATPSPSLVGLCRAFQAGATDNPGKALQNPAFSVLVSTAGGADNVAAFCLEMVGPAVSHTGHGRMSGAPVSHPVGPPAGHPGPPSPLPGGGRSGHPTGAPVSHPTGAPTILPTGHA